MQATSQVRGRRLAPESNLLYFCGKSLLCLIDLVIEVPHTIIPYLMGSLPADHPPSPEETGVCLRKERGWPNPIYTHQLSTWPGLVVSIQPMKACTHVPTIVFDSLRRYPEFNGGKKKMGSIWSFMTTSYIRLTWILNTSAVVRRIGKWDQTYNDASSPWSFVQV